MVADRTSSPRIASILFVVLFGLCTSLAAQDDPFVRCTKCKNLGAKPCHEHRDADCELEANVLYCSFIGLCETCGGTGWVDCERCENPAVEGRLAKKRAAIPELADQVAYYETDLGRPLTLAVTARYEIVWDVEKIKVGKKLIGQHQMLHLYADRLERLFSDYQELLDVPASAFERRVRVLVWSNFQQHDEAALRYCNQTFQAGVRLLGVRPTYSVPGVRKLFPNDDFLHRNIIHNTTHLILSHQEPSHWMGITKGGWADAGLAHWFEDRYFGICDTYCYQERDTTQGIQVGKWKVRLRKQVQEGESPPLAAMFRENTDTLTPDQHVAAFSLIDYLIQLDAKKLDRLLVLLRKKLETRDALKEAFDITPLALEVDWKAWVLATYPKR